VRLGDALIRAFVWLIPPNSLARSKAARNRPNDAAAGDSGEYPLSASIVEGGAVQGQTCTDLEPSRAVAATHSRSARCFQNPQGDALNSRAPETKGT